MERNKHFNVINLTWLQSLDNPINIRKFQSVNSADGEENFYLKNYEK